MADSWIGTWMAAPQLTEPGNLPPAPGFSDTTLRQVVRLSLGGRWIRIRLSNEFGTEPLTISSAQVALPGASGAIRPGSERKLTYDKKTAVVVAPGYIATFDPLPFDVPPMADLAITMHVRTTSSAITGHPGSRCTSYLGSGDQVSAPELKNATTVDHWYFLTGVEVMVPRKAGAVVVLGDSITDGRGSPTNGNGRWTDFLMQRLMADKSVAGQVAVLNAGIGGNCVIRGGLGPTALSRLERDVLTRPGVRWLILFEGINDLGGRRTSAAELIAAYKQIIARAKPRGIRVYGATILPCGQSFYYMPELEANRQELNTWIRTGGAFDAVIDLDAAMRDPTMPNQLSPKAESPDHLHPSGNGYKVLADAIDLGLFQV